jgi:hypothetical protein
MLTCTFEIYRERFSFRVFGTAKARTQVFRFLSSYLDGRTNKKLVSVLNAINTDPLMYSHEQKFKHLEGDVWEIKIKSLRIACTWDPKPRNLIAVYAMIKDRPKWSKQDIENMRKQLASYLSKRRLPLERKPYEGIDQIPE